MRWQLAILIAMLNSRGFAGVTEDMGVHGGVSAPLPPPRVHIKPNPPPTPHPITPLILCGVKPCGRKGTVGQ